LIKLALMIISGIGLYNLLKVPVKAKKAPVKVKRQASMFPARVHSLVEDYPGRLGEISPKEE